MDKFVLARENMIKGQMLPNKIINRELLEIISEVPRQSFVPEKFKCVAYSDESLQVGEGRFVIAPVVFARMVQAAAVTKEDTVLDVACGSGYSSAILSGLAKKVVAIESNPDLASKANLTLKSMNVGNTIILNNKLADGSPEGAPYDVIFINGAVEKAPVALMSQLGEGGRLVTVIKESEYGGCAVMFRKENGDVTKIDLFDAIVPLLKDL